MDSKIKKLGSNVLIGLKNYKYGFKNNICVFQNGNYELSIL